MKNKYYRLILIITIIILYFIINYYKCILIKYKNIPEIIGKEIDLPGTYLVFLYGDNVCPTCPVGQYLYKISKQKNSIYIVPKDYSNFDIENLRSTYNLKGKVYNENKETGKYLKKISLCIKNQKTKNIFIEVKSKRKIKRMFAL